MQCLLVGTAACSQTEQLVAVIPSLQQIQIAPVYMQMPITRA